MTLIYARQSVDKKDSISIETQINMCQREVPDGEPSMVFQDRGFSGKSTARPGFMKLMNTVECGEASRVVVYRLDRISRSITDFSGIMSVLEAHKVDFVSANEKFDTSTPVGRAMLYIIMVFAQLERETIAERIKDNYYARGKNGVWLGGPAPLGFDIIRIEQGNKKIPVLFPNADIELVKEIYDAYSQTNISLGTLAKEMREKHGGMWNNVKLARILHNPAYVRADADIYRFYEQKKCIVINDTECFIGRNGCSLYGKRDRGSNKYNLTAEHILAIAQHEGVVDSHTFLSCQRKLSSNRQVKNSGKGKHSWLSGLVKCGYCGYGNSIYVYKNTRYFRCSGKDYRDHCERTATVYVSDIEDAVSVSIEAYVKALPDRYVSSSDSNAELNKLKIELLGIDKAIQNLIASLAESGSSSARYIDEKITELDHRKNLIIDEMNSLQENQFDAEELNIDGWDEMDMEMRRGIARKLIDKVALYNDHIDIVWKRWQ